MERRIWHAKMMDGLSEHECSRGRKETLLKVTQQAPLSLWDSLCKLFSGMKVSPNNLENTTNSHEGFPPTSLAVKHFYDTQGLVLSSMLRWKWERWLLSSSRKKWGKGTSWAVPLEVPSPRWSVGECVSSSLPPPLPWEVLCLEMLSMFRPSVH